MSIRFDSLPSTALQSRFSNTYLDLARTTEGGSVLGARSSQLLTRPLLNTEERYNFVREAIAQSQDSKIKAAFTVLQRDRSRLEQAQGFATNGQPNEAIKILATLELGGASYAEYALKSGGKIAEVIQTLMHFNDLGSEKVYLASEKIKTNSHALANHYLEGAGFPQPYEGSATPIPKHIMHQLNWPKEAEDQGLISLASAVEAIKHGDSALAKVYIASAAQSFTGNPQQRHGAVSTSALAVATLKAQLGDNEVTRGIGDEFQDQVKAILKGLSRRDSNGNHGV